ncbi:unnamed protein product [Heligmosomoides polygyrus]|uniref:Integrase catalytic domain-containing protein n=1 Tax=Heligmosomoides polygyrus TaxID=6339 RepID=A0A183GGA1_HELPZ|nr:unnamed protein product [Heligmosomoides polygyrus]
MCVARTLRTCITCKKANAVPYRYPDIPPLPPERVCRSRPFQNVGLDYLGPLACTGTTTGKIGICLITCMATRAIHSEVFLDNTTQEFLFAFRRFVARRGSSNVVYCDNSSTFHAAESAITTLLYSSASWRTVSEFCLRHKITWKFIPPLSPWKRGFYERLVGLFKAAFKKSVGRAVLPLTLLQTVVTEVEATLNSRPITPYREKDVFVHVLRPIDFLIPEVDMQIPPSPQQSEEFLTASHNLAMWYKETVAVLDQLWEVWYNDYLAALRERHQTRSKNARSSPTTPHVGDVVLVADDNTSRGQWNYGLIEKVHVGKDSSIKSVDVSTPNDEILTRAVSALYPLEITSAKTEPSVESDKTAQKSLRWQPLRAAKTSHAFIIPLGPLTNINSSAALANIRK